MPEKRWLWLNREAWLGEWGAHLLVARPGVGQHLLRIIILDLRLFVHHFVVRRLEQLFAAVLQLGSNFLFDARIRELTLTRRLHGDQLNDKKTARLPGCGIDLSRN